MHPTKNSLQQSVRTKVIPVLAGLLIDSTDLYNHCKQAHWNVRGAGFIGLHKVFDTLATEVSNATDVMAERILQLGSGASGPARMAGEPSRLKAYPLTIGSGEQHVEAIASSLSSFNSFVQDAIDGIDEMGDAVTADILTEVARILDKQLWIVEAHMPLKGAASASRLSSVTS